MKKFLTAILSVLLIATVAMFASACKAPEEDKKPGDNNTPPCSNARRYYFGRIA